MPFPKDLNDQSEQTWKNHSMNELLREIEPQSLIQKGQYMRVFPEKKSTKYVSFIQK
jgi:hypothetical protein